MIDAADTLFTPAVDDDILHPVVVVYRDAQDDLVYWCGWTNGHDGQGWTAERKEALEYESLSAANLEKRQIRRWHPGMTATAERLP
jgi:hypothetical protein